VAPYRILSIDGGGIRGLLTAVLLDRLVTAVPGWLDRVDLFAGTSTGGILVLGLAKGLPPSAIVKLYRQDGQRVFSASWLRRLLDLGGWLGARYDNAGLRGALEELLGPATLGDLPRRVLVPTFELDNHGAKDLPRTWKPKFFHNFPGPDSDAAERVVDVAVRTSAAPTYFPTYQGYIDGGVMILDIADRSRPRLVSRLDYHPPMPGFTHTVVPLLSRDLLAVSDEAVRDGGADWPKLVWLVDVSTETNPTILGTAPLPYEELRSRGGRVGAHNLHENDPGGVAWRSDDFLVGAFFNGGVRAYDVGDPFHPREVGHLVPAAPAGAPAGAVQVNDVFVDENRLIYAVDRFTGGLYLVEADF